jgi:hypothetical protein
MEQPPLPIEACDPAGFMQYCNCYYFWLILQMTLPLAQDDSFTGPEDVVINRNCCRNNDSDIDGDVLTFTRNYKSC